MPPRIASPQLRLLIALALLCAPAALAGPAGPAPTAPSPTKSNLPPVASVRQAETASSADSYLAASQRAFADGSFEQALTAARQATAIDPSRGHAAAARALGALEAWPRAREAAEIAFAQNSSGDHALLLAWTLRKQQQNEAAITVLVKALAADSDSDSGQQHSAQSRLRQELALLYLHSGKADAAFGVTSTNPAHKIDDGVAGLVLAAQRDRQEQAVPLLLKALQASSSRDGQAEVSGNGGNSESNKESVVPRQVLRKELGAALLALGRTQEAAKYLQQAYDHGPQTAALAYSLAGAYRALGQREDAAALLEEFQRLRIEEDQRDTAQRKVGADLNAAQELAAANKLQPALRQVEQVLAEHPQSFTAHALRGKVLFSLGQMDAGLEAMQTARNLRPGIVEFRYLEGLFLRTMGRPSEARQALEAAVALQPDLVEAHSILGGILLEMGKSQESLRHLERAIALGASGQQIERARALAAERSKTEVP